jgi:hypothetical protein
MACLNRSSGYLLTLPPVGSPFGTNAQPNFSNTAMPPAWNEVITAVPTCFPVLASSATM